MKHNSYEMLPQGEIDLAKDDFDNLYNNDHDWGIWLSQKFGLASASDLPALPQPTAHGFDRAKLVYNSGTGKYGKGYAEAEVVVSKKGIADVEGRQGLSAIMQLTGAWTLFSGKVAGDLSEVAVPSQSLPLIPAGTRVFCRIDVSKVSPRKGQLSFDGHLALGDPDNVIYNFGMCKVAVSSPVVACA